MSYIGTTKIGKMYLGDTEIAKAYLGTDLVFQKGGVPPTPVDPGDLSNYAQEGLVLHLDGIDKGETSGRWSSLVGSEYYPLTTHSTEETNAVLMDGSGVLTSVNTVNVGYTVGTIEVCAQYLGSSSCVVIYGTSNNLCFCIGSTGYAFGIATANNLWTLTKSNLFTCSMNSTRCMLNGSVTGTKSNTSWGATESTNFIGGREPYANKYYANIRIYSIRKYNRILTEAEMLQNQKVDNARFNLGFNIQ